MSAEFEKVHDHKAVVTFTLGPNIVKVDVMNTKTSGTELSATLTGLEAVIDAVKSNIATNELISTSHVHRVQYIPRTEWTSGTLVYKFGNNDSFTELSQSGSTEILCGLKSWFDTLNAAYVALKADRIPDYSEIIPGLYVGSVDSVRYLVRKQLVKRVINCSAEVRNVAAVDNSSYLIIPLNDSGTIDDQAVLADNIKRVMMFLDRETFNESPVLIHCQMGVSRSPTVAAAYLLHSGQCGSVAEAKSFVKRMRPVAFEGCAKNTYDTALVEMYDF